MRKPIFIPTGEEIDITTVIDVPTKTATFCETGDERQVPIPAELIAFPPNMEKRRYELAKAFMCDRLANETDLGYIRRHYKEMAQVSVQCADALLVELEAQAPSAQSRQDDSQEGTPKSQPR